MGSLVLNGELFEFSDDEVPFRDEETSGTVKRFKMELDVAFGDEETSWTVKGFKMTEAYEFFLKFRDLTAVHVLMGLSIVNLLKFCIVSKVMTKFCLKDLSAKFWRSIYYGDIYYPMMCNERDKVSLELKELNELKLEKLKLKKLDDKNGLKELKELTKLKKLELKDLNELKKRFLDLMSIDDEEERSEYPSHKFTGNKRRVMKWKDLYKKDCTIHIDKILKGVNLERKKEFVSAIEIKGSNIINNWEDNTKEILSFLEKRNFNAEEENSPFDLIYLTNKYHPRGEFEFCFSEHMKKYKQLYYITQDVFKKGTLEFSVKEKNDFKAITYSFFVFTKDKLSDTEKNVLFLRDVESNENKLYELREIDIDIPYDELEEADLSKYRIRGDLFIIRFDDGNLTYAIICEDSQMNGEPKRTIILALFGIVPDIFSDGINQYIMNQQMRINSLSTINPKFT